MIYSRNLENLSKAYPDVIENIKQIVKDLHVDNFIMDSELVAFDIDQQKILPF